MRLIRALVAILCLALGAVVGALNLTPVTLDLGGTSVETTLGIAVLVALLVGVLVGGIAISASAVMPLRRRLARLQRERDGLPGEGS